MEENHEQFDVCQNNIRNRIRNHRRRVGSGAYPFATARLVHGGEHRLYEPVVAASALSIMFTPPFILTTILRKFDVDYDDEAASVAVHHAAH